MVLVYMLTWLGYIDGIHGAPYMAAPWIRHWKWDTPKNRWFIVENPKSVHYQWIGFDGTIFTGPPMIFMEKSMVSGEDFPLKTNPL